ncbi:MAG: T9SS type A sorting domain-containing protein [Bacteroidaceae bacterium]|nr:T9SS type A sorting domain-containing protein [Bacteroidaceae bacterium]
MMKKILIMITAAFLLAMPMDVEAQDIQQQRTTIEQEVAPITISVNESTIHIKNAEKMVIEIYNMTGVKVVTQRIDSSDKIIELDNLPKGCYIIKIGKVARKVYLR